MTKPELIELCHDLVRDSIFISEAEPENTELHSDLEFYQRVLAQARVIDPSKIEDFVDNYSLADFL